MNVEMGSVESLKDIGKPGMVARWEAQTAPLGQTHPGSLCSQSALPGGEESASLF